MSNKKLTENVFAPIRENEVHKWIDVLSGSSCLERAKERAEEEDLDCPLWAKYNPVVGYARCKVSVVEYVEEV